MGHPIGMILATRRAGIVWRHGVVGPGRRLVASAVVTVFAAAVVIVVSVSSWLDRRHVTAPMVFLLLGAVIGTQLTVTADGAPVVQALTQTTLAMILFHDAAQVLPAQLRRDAALSARLLLVGLPLTIVAGLVIADLLLPTSGWLALFVASALAPTDAGLGAATVLNPAVPARVRRVLNVESGLNDGLATPVVLLAVSVMAEPGVSDEAHLLGALRELILGVLVGTLSGVGAGVLLTRCRRRGLSSPHLVPLAVLVLPLLAYYGSAAAGGNGFVGAFVSGTAFAAARSAKRIDDHQLPRQPGGEDPAVQLTESLSTILGYAVWAVFGAVAVPHLWQHLTWGGVVFAVLSLTVLRMVPVALALAGTHLTPRTVVFIGWFGPRGLASVVFALIAVQSLPSNADLSVALGTIELTVLLSVFLHGVTAGPWARRYGTWARRVHPAVEMRI